MRNTISNRMTDLIVDYTLLQCIILLVRDYRVARVVCSFTFFNKIFHSSPTQNIYYTEKRNKSQELFYIKVLENVRKVFFYLFFTFSQCLVFPVSPEKSSLLLLKSNGKAIPSGVGHHSSSKLK